MEHKEELKKLVEIAKNNSAKDGKKLRNEEIAERLGYSRSHFSTMLGERAKVEESHIRHFKSEFVNELRGTTPTDLDLTASLHEIRQHLIDIKNQQAIARAEVRAFGEYQVMKDAQNDDQKRKDLMATVNTLIGLNLRVDEQTGNVHVARMQGM